MLSLNPGNGFNAEDDMLQSSLVPLPASSAHESDDDIPLAKVAQRLSPQEKHTFTDLVTADTDLIVTEEMTDDDIVAELLDKNNNWSFSRK